MAQIKILKINPKKVTKNSQNIYSQTVIIHLSYLFFVSPHSYY